MLGEIVPVVAAGVEMEFVGDFLRFEQVVEILRASVETELVFGAAVEVNFHAHGAGAFFDDRERIVAVPEAAVEGLAESRTHLLAERLGLGIVGSANFRQFRDERCAVRAYGAEKLWIEESEAQRAVAAHGDAG